MADVGYRARRGRSGSAFWRMQLAVLALLAVLGAWYASADAGTTASSTSGLILFVCALALALHRVKAHFDGGEEGWWQSLFIDTMGNLAIVVPLFVVIGLAGLFLAAASGVGQPP